MAIGRVTIKEEQFCREYVRCGIASEAYRIVFPTKKTRKPETEWVEASRLMAKPKVALRIREMMDAATDVSLGEIVSGFRQARDGALVDRQHSAVTGAVTALARVKGFLKDDPAKAGDIHIHFDDLLRGVL